MIKFKKLTENWSLRKLTLFGKITVIKAFLASQLVYVLTSLRTCEKTLKEINDLLFKFLWDGKGDKIKRTVMTNDYKDGGAKMLDIRAFNRALKATWITKYLDNSNKGKWKNLFNYSFCELGGKNAFLSNLSKKDLQDFEMRDKFAKEVMEIWTEINFEITLKSFEDFSEQYLWHNSLIRIGNKPVMFKKWYEKGVMKVDHLLQQNRSSRFLSHLEFQAKYGLETPFLQYAGLISSLSHLRRKITHEQGIMKVDNKNLINNTFAGLSSTKSFYKSFNEQLGTKPTKSQTKWEKDCELKDPEQMRWETIYCKSFDCSKSTTLRNFQFKLLHRKIATNTFLQKIGIKDTNSCTFCQKDIETLMHLFWTCEKTQTFWTSLEGWLHSVNVLSTKKVIDKLDAIGLNSDIENCLLGFCKLSARYYIYTCRLKGKTPRMTSFLNQLKCYASIEKEILSTKDFHEKWKPLLSVLPI